MRVPILFTMLLVADPAAGQELRLPETALPEPRVIAEQGSSPLYYRQTPNIVLPTIRIGPGLQMRLPVNKATVKAAFTIDLFFGSAIRLGRAAPTGLLLEGGYSYVGFSEHLAALGLGVLHGLGRPPAKPGESQPLGRTRIGLVPHALVGFAYGNAAWGARTSLILGYWIYGVELAHQVLFVGPRQFHEIHLTLTGITPIGEDP